MDSSCIQIPPSIKSVVTKKHQKYNLVMSSNEMMMAIRGEDNDDQNEKLPARLIDIMGKFDNVNVKTMTTLSGHHKNDSNSNCNNDSRTLTLDRVVNSFLSISNDMDESVIDIQQKTCSIELLGEKTLKAGSMGQPVINYYLPIKIGEPGRVYRIQFDLATNDIFVAHYELVQELKRKLGLKTILRNDQSYRCKRSETGRKIDRRRQRGIEFHGTRYEGKMYEDCMQFSVMLQPDSSKSTTFHHMDQDMDKANICLDQHFLAIKKASKQRANLSLLPVHGYMGLGPRLRSPTGIKSFLLNLRDDSHINRLQFSFWFNRWTPSARLILGGVQRDKYMDPIEWHGSDVNEWSVELELVELGRDLISNYTSHLTRATINLAINEILGPREAIRRIHHRLGISSSNRGLPLIESNVISLMPALILYINDIGYRIEARNYIRWCEDGAYVAIMPSKNNRWILGSIFLETRYNIFDLERHKIGFARLHPSLL